MLRSVLPQTQGPPVLIPTQVLWFLHWSIQEGNNRNVQQEKASEASVLTSRLMGVEVGLVLGWLLDMLGEVTLEVTPRGRKSLEAKLMDK